MARKRYEEGGDSKQHADAQQYLSSPILKKNADGMDGGKGLASSPEIYSMNKIRGVEENRTQASLEYDEEEQPYLKNNSAAIGTAR